MKWKDYLGIDDSFHLKSVRVAPCHLPRFFSIAKETIDFVDVDIAVQNGRITSISPSFTSNSNSQSETLNEFNLENRLVIPTLTDIHTHLDKSHSSYRSPNDNGTWQSALVASINDRKYFGPIELRQRVEFCLQTAYHHGTSAIRTHVVSTCDLEYTRTVWTILSELYTNSHLNNLTTFCEAVAHAAGK